MNHQKRKSELIAYSLAIYERGLVHAAGGNTSVRLGDEIWITQTGTVLGELAPGDLTKVDMDGNILTSGVPSKELEMHLAMYRARPEVKTIMHVHPTNAIAYSCLLDEPSLDAVPAYTAAFHMRAGRVPMTPYYHSGSRELHEAVAALAPDYHAILLRQHGVMVGAGSLIEAIGILDEIEQCCKIALLTGGKGTALTDQQRAEIDESLGRTWPD